MSTTGPITWTTLPIFCFAATSVAMFSPCPLWFLPLRRRLRAGYDLDDFACDRGLAHFVHVQRQAVDDFTRVFRRRVHRRHARGVLGGRRLQQRAINLNLN